MLPFLTSMVRRHRNKILVGGAVIGGAILLSKGLQNLALEKAESNTSERFRCAERLEQYGAIDNLCTSQVIQIVKALEEKILTVLDTNTIIDELKKKKNNRKLWHKLKIMSFAKVVVMIYTSSMITILLRIQLSMYSGYIVQKQDQMASGNEFQSNGAWRFLNWYDTLISKHFTELAQDIISKVEYVVEGRPLEAELTLHELENLFWAIQSKIIDSEFMKEVYEKYFKAKEEYFLTGTENKYVAQLLRNMVKDTADIMGSSEFSSVFISTINTGLLLVTEQLRDFYQVKGTNVQADLQSTSNVNILQKPGDVRLSQIAIPIAKIIPILNSFVGKRDNDFKFNDIMVRWKNCLTNMEVIKVLGANVFETFSFGS